MVVLAFYWGNVHQPTKGQNYIFTCFFLKSQTISRLSDLIKPHIPFEYTRSLSNLTRVYLSIHKYFLLVCQNLQLTLKQSPLQRYQHYHDRRRSSWGLAICLRHCPMHKRFSRYKWASSVNKSPPQVWINLIELLPLLLLKKLVSFSFLSGQVLHCLLLSVCAFSVVVLSIKIYPFVNAHIYLNRERKLC